ncbi:hypothetical protein M0R45_015581 [Rubus argutus]|uniref:Uncharacterized protein n=1 Tax=Rubus argutus TaxID=59490 RepID=A0AAW1XPN5_RUBAR
MGLRVAAGRHLGDGELVMAVMWYVGFTVRWKGFGSEEVKVLVNGDLRLRGAARVEFGMAGYDVNWDGYDVGCFGHGLAGRIEVLIW